MKKNILFFIVFILNFVVFAQQDPQYTQYMYNQSIINPGYATNDLGIINFGAINRSQWASSVGAPKSFNFFIHTPISEKIEIGASFVADNTGDGTVKENNFYADVAYVLNLKGNHKLSFGLKAGFTNFRSSFDGFRFPDDDIINGAITNDPAFENQSKIFPNIGAGLFYFTDDYYVGFSAPNLLKTQHLDDINGIQRLGSEEIHLFLTGGYVFTINSGLKLKPAIMTKYVKGSPVVLDTSLNVLFNNRFEGGIAYRINDSFSAMFNLKATTSLRIGYAYDFTTSNLGNFNSGTHEIMVLYDLDLTGLTKGYDKSPRFF